jgi:DNA-binding NtrC family response regulator
MKTKLLILAIVLGALTPVFAQLKTTTTNDGIAASPKLHQQMNERAAYAPRPAVVTIKTATGTMKMSCTGRHIAASPRAKATFSHLNASCCGMSSCVVVCAR